jgi:hypothetical protein
MEEWRQGVREEGDTVFVGMGLGFESFEELEDCGFVGCG